MPLSLILEKDRNFVWHPFTQAQTASPPIPIISGDGAYLMGCNGTRYFDAISSWWVNLHGHAHPYIADSIARQAHRLEQVIFADFTHIGAIQLAERLVSLLKINKGRVFFSDNGSTAVETALKIAIQYWHNRTKKHPKTKVVSFRHAYHGDTFGAMSASGATAFNHPFRPHLFEVHTIDPPYHGQEESSIQQLKNILAHDDVACFIFEPIIQGVAGMHIHSASGLNTLLELCQQHEVITIADEVMTGFGRTGPLFACERLSIQPDITCLSKGITGGFMPLGATVCHERIYEGFLSKDLQKALLHGHSYCANPLACAAALASLDLLTNPACTLQRRMIEMLHQRFLTQYGDHPNIARCHVTGTILCLEYKEKGRQANGYFAKRQELIDFFRNQHILIRPLGNILYLMPPYCSSEADLLHVYKCIRKSLEIYQ